MAEGTGGHAALDPARSVSLEASAGSGKTWQLVSRIVRLLLAGAEPGGILALTFTRKAAVEMRLRLNERLRRLSLGSDAELAQALAGIGVEPTAEHCARARDLYRQMLFAPHPPRAMTLHAFSQELLARFALEAQVPPDFALYENEAELIERAWRRLQDRLTAARHDAAGEALRTLVELGFNDHTLRELVALFLAHRGDWWAYTEDEPDPVACAVARLRGELGPCDAQQALRDIDSDAFSLYLGTLWRWLSQWGAVGSIRAERLESAVALRGEARLTALADALLTDKGEPYAFQPARNRFTDAQRTSLVETHAEVLRRFLAAHDEWTRAQALRRAEAAFTLGAAALEALGAELAREHALGFTELEWRTCRLLRGDGAADWVRYRLDRRVDHLLIDEFQDTSPTQWRMLLPLLEEMAAGDAGRPRSLFVVGDAKQSIYGFRRADPRLLGRATAWMLEHLRAHREPLHDSRRSAPAVIDFVNALFAIGELGPRIGFTPHATHRREDWGRVEVAPPIEHDAPEATALAGPFRDPFAQPRHAREDLRAQREAAQVSARIRALVESGVEVTTPLGTRRIGWGDVMVLARARTHLHHLERQLTADGIPFVGAARGTLLETSLARDLIALLRLLDSPHRNLELAQVLRSPLFGADDALLARIATACHGPDGAGNWFEALARLAPSEPLLGRAHALLSGWRALAAQLPAHDLLDRIARDIGVAARYEAALPPVTGARARANLGAFLQLALEADAGRYPSLPRFLQWLEGQQRAYLEAPDEPPPAAATEQVRIMTIHAAKGLEAPAVFLVNSGRSFAPRTPRLLIEWPESAPRPTHFAVTGPGAKPDALARRLAERHKAREADEELHVLYVAATRARHFLHVSGFAPAARGGKSWHGYALRAMETLERAPPVPGTAPGSLCYAVGTPRTVPAIIPIGAARPVDPRLRAPLAAATAAPAAPSERVAAVPYESPEAAARGIALHLLLQRLSEGPATEDELRDAVRARLDDEPRDFGRWIADARAVLADPALAHLFVPEKYARAWNEVPVAVDGTTAVIDRLVDDGAALWIVDYKTHTRAEAEPLAERYRPQLAAYAQAVRAIWPGRPVRAGLLLTATRTWVEVVPA